MHLVQALQYLEDLEVSDGSENDSDLETEHQDETKIFIQMKITVTLVQVTKKIQVLIIQEEINFLLLCHLW